MGCCRIFQMRRESKTFDRQDIWGVGQLLEAREQIILLRIRLNQSRYLFFGKAEMLALTGIQHRSTKSLREGISLWSYGFWMSRLEWGESASFEGILVASLTLEWFTSRVAFLGLSNWRRWKNNAIIFQGELETNVAKRVLPQWVKRWQHHHQEEQK